MDQRLFFGLGELDNVDKIEVKWADGKIQTLPKTNANQEITITYQPNASKLSDKTKSDIVLQEISDEKLNINWTHEENNFEDFAKEVLLPQKQSTMGPALAVGDINNDGLDDIYLGGAFAQKASFYLQSEDGTFSPVKSKAFENDKYCEDNDAIFVDANGDKVSELITASGGSGEMLGKENLLQDRFYVINKGTYSKATYENKVDVLAPDFKNIPLVRDIEFSDLNKDGIQDFIVVSEWGKPEVFLSHNGQYSKVSSDYITEEKYGWWQSIKKVDIDNDGDDDFILGNIGKNIKHKVSDEKPLYLYANDFDKNGTLDVVLAKEYKGRIVPARGKECSTEQMPFIEKKIKTYKEFANSDIIDILGEKSVEESHKYKATSFASYVLINNDGKFEYKKLPSYAQIAPIYDMVIYDIDNDGYSDIIAVGNNYDTEYETPRLDAGRGVVLMNKAGKEFDALMPYESQLNLDGNFRKIRLINRKDDKLLVAAQNNGPLKFYKLQ
jgi:hypothetical protein